MLLRSIGSAALWLTSWCCGAGVWACVVWCRYATAGLGLDAWTGLAVQAGATLVGGLAAKVVYGAATAPKVKA